MKYLIDTCTISYYSKDVETVVEKFRQNSPQNMAISVISLFEIEHGMLKNPTKQRVRVIQTAFINEVSVMDINAEIAKEAASIHTKLVLAGRSIQLQDIFIAATALAHDLILVTSNLRDFERIDGLKIEDWR